MTSLIRIRASAVVACFLSMCFVGCGNLKPKIGIVDDIHIVIGSPIEMELMVDEGTPPIEWLKIKGPEGLQVTSSGILKWCPEARESIATHSCAVEAINEAGSDRANFSIIVGVTEGFEQAYEYAKVLSGALKTNDVDTLPGDGVIFLREHDGADSILGFRLGFKEGYGEDCFDLVVDLVRAAEESTDEVYRKGFEIGNRMTIEEERIGNEEARRALMENVNTNRKLFFAWQAGFLKGYGDGAHQAYHSLVLSLRR